MEKSERHWHSQRYSRGTWIYLFWANRNRRWTGTPDISERNYGSPQERTTRHTNRKSKPHCGPCTETHGNLCIQREYGQHYWQEQVDKNVAIRYPQNKPSQNCLLKWTSVTYPKRKQILEGYNQYAPRIRCLLYPIYQLTRISPRHVACPLWRNKLSHPYSKAIPPEARRVHTVPYRAGTKSL